MSINKGLGKGLGALIAMFDEENENLIKDTQTATKSTKKIESFSMTTTIPQKDSKKVLQQNDIPASPATTVGAGVSEIEITLIDNNINQPRKSFDPVQLQELADSIASSGIFQPILLNKVGERYLIVAGERRWRAAKLAGLTKVPALVRNYSPRQVAEIAIIENLQRENLNEIELARGIKKLMDEFFLTQEKVATVLGKSRSSIANTLRLLNLPSEVQLIIESNQLSVGHAKCLVAIANSEKCIKLAKQCIIGRLSVRELENLIKDAQETSPSQTKPKQTSAEIRQLAITLTQALGTKVIIQGNEKQGRIIIDYYDKKDLIRLTDHLRQN